MSRLKETSVTSNKQSKEVKDFFCLRAMMLRLTMSNTFLYIPIQSLKISSNRRRLTMSLSPSWGTVGADKVPPLLPIPPLLPYDEDLLLLLVKVGTCDVTRADESGGIDIFLCCCDGC